MKSLSNGVTALRIAFSLALLITEPFSQLFFIFYINCGLSDIADGFIARKFSIESKLGARLDSIADITFITVILVRLIPLVKIPFYIISWIVLIAAIRVASMFIALYKYHTFASLHTYANKATGILFFCFPLLLNIVSMNSLAGIICFAASLSAIEEMIIHICSKELNLDVSGLFAKKKITRS